MTRPLRVSAVLFDLDGTLADSAGDLALALNRIRESRGVVASGRFGAQGTFMAQEVLAKHEETYAPPASAGDRALRPAWVRSP